MSIATFSRHTHPLLLARIKLISLLTLMFLKLKHDDDSSLIEVLDLKQLFDPFTPSVEARLHGGEEHRNRSCM